MGFLGYTERKISEIISGVSGYQKGPECVFLSFLMGVETPHTPVVITTAAMKGST
jgi:hypothetical protein